MDEEEPAWKAELCDALERIAWDIERGNGLQGGIDYARNELGSTVFAAIEAAEERGRREARKEAAGKLQEFADNANTPAGRAIYGAMADIFKQWSGIS